MTKITSMIGKACGILFGRGGKMTTHDTMSEQATAARPRTEKATFGAGCFWGVETTFRNIPGVVDAAVGYAGGTLANPTYRDVCSDRTGHAEVVEVEYDPSVVTYDQLLEVFWEN